MIPDSPNTAGAIESWLQHAVADRLSVDPAFIDMASPLTDLGLDSLAIIHLSAVVGDRLGVVLDPMMLVGAGTLIDVAQIVADLIAERGASAQRPDVQAGSLLLVWASFSPEPLAEALARAFSTAGGAIAVRTAPFAEIDEAPHAAAADQTLVAALRLADRPAALPAIEWAQQIARNVAGWRRAFGRVVAVLCPEPDGDSSPQLVELLTATVPAIEIIDGRRLGPDTYDAATDAMGRVPYSPAGFEALAAVVAERLAASIAVSTPPQAPPPWAGTPSAARLFEDATCPPDVGRPPAPPSEDRWRSVLLTGATGFVGAHLLHALLTQTDAIIECHVRAATPDEAVARVRSSLECHGLWRPEHAARIAGLPGDLALPRLGLAEAEWTRLAGGLDAVIHNGAAVNFIYSYEALKPANVDATAEILRLAATGRVKPLHFVSTVGLVTGRSSDGAPIAEDADPGDPAGLANGYEQSKWVADRMVAAAIARGLPASIYRLGLVSGDSRSSRFEHDDFLSALIVTALSLGALPDLGGRLPMIPVDIVARALVTTALRPGALGHCYHLVHPEPMTGRYLAVLARRRGYDVRLLPWTAWRQAILQPGRLAGTELEAYAGFLRNAETLAVPALSMTNAMAAAGPVLASCPAQRDLLGRMLDGFAEQGRLTVPGDRSGGRAASGLVTRLVAMDVDRTLIEGQSQSYLVGALFRAGLLPRRMYLRVLWWFLLHKSFGWRPANPTRLQQIVLKHLAGLPVDRLVPVFQQVVDTEIFPRVRPAALACLRRWQDDGALVFLVSASVEPLIGLLAMKLRADGVVATRIRGGGALFSGELDGGMVAGEAKWQRLMEDADAGFAAWRLEAAYGDDDTDIPLLSRARHAFAVGPTAGLRDAATKRGWTILDWAGAISATEDTGSRQA